MNELRFQDPLWLLLLIPVFVAGLRSIRRDRRTAVVFSSVELVRGLPITLAQRCRRFLPWLRIAGMALIVVGLARPQRGLAEFRIRAEGIAIEMCIDRSGSMKAMDFSLDGRQVNRLEAVKQVFRDFVTGGSGFAGRPDDQIGLVAFGGFADAKCPLTLDHGTLLQVLDTVQIPEPVMDRQGRVINERILQEEQATAIGDAIAVAVDRLRNSEAKSRVIVLLSDGENTAGEVTPEEAAEAAAAWGIRIYTIGAGSTGMAPFPMVDVFGREVLQPQPVSLDETTLKALAGKTGGQYYSARDTEGLRRVYEEIDRMEKTVTDGLLYSEYRELFQALLLPGLGCVVLELVLSATRFRTLP